MLITTMTFSIQSEGSHDPMKVHNRGHFSVERMPLGSQRSRRDKRDLVFGTPAGFAADPLGVVRQHLTVHGVLGIALGHRLHDLVLNQLGGRVAHAERALQG